VQASLDGVRSKPARFLRSSPAPQGTTDPREGRGHVEPGLRAVVVGGWIASLAVIVVVSTALDANGSTTALLVALDVAPALVALLIAVGVPSASVAGILHRVEIQGSR